MLTRVDADSSYFHGYVFLKWWEYKNTRLRRGCVNLIIERNILLVLFDRKVGDADKSLVSVESCADSSLYLLLEPLTQEYWKAYRECHVSMEFQVSQKLVSAFDESVAFAKDRQGRFGEWVKPRIYLL